MATTTPTANRPEGQTKQGMLSLGAKLRAMSEQAQQSSESAQAAAQERYVAFRAEQVLALSQSVLAAVLSPRMIQEMERTADTKPPPGGRRRVACFLDLGDDRVMMKPMWEGPDRMHTELTHVVGPKGPDGKELMVSFAEMLYGPKPGKDGKERRIEGGNVLDQVNKTLEKRGEGLYVAVEERPSHDERTSYRVAFPVKGANGQQEWVWSMTRDGEPRRETGIRLQLVVTWDREAYEASQAAFHEKKAAQKAARKAAYAPRQEDERDAHRQEERERGPRAPVRPSRAEDFVPATKVRPRRF